MYLKNPKLSQDDMQLIFDCILFTSTPDIGWKADKRIPTQAFELIKKFQAAGWKGSEQLYLSKGSGQYEIPILSQFLEDTNVVKPNK